MTNRIIFSLFVFVFFVACSGDEPEVPEPDKLGKLYYTAHSDRIIGLIELKEPGDGTPLYDFFDDGLNPVMNIRIDHDAQMLYSAEHEDDRIIRMKADGSGDIEVLYDSDDGVGSPQGLGIDPQTGLIYWANKDTHQIMRGSMDGTLEPEEMYGGSEVYEYHSYGMWVDHDAGLLYFVDQNWARIYAGNLDGSGTPALIVPTIDGLICTSSIQVVDNKIYWTDYCVDKIMSIGLDGSSFTVLYDETDGIDGPFGLYVDKENDRIYWSETVPNVIAYGNMDGTAEPVIIDELVNCYGIVLDKD